MHSWIFLKADMDFWQVAWDLTKVIGKLLLTAFEIIIAGAAVWIIFRKKWKAWYDHYRKGRNTRWTFIDQVLQRIEERLKRVEHQVFPDQGGSVIDNQVIIHKLITDLTREFRIAFSDLKMGQRNNRELMGRPSWESDSEGKFFYVSPSLCSMLGYTPDQLIHESWQGLICAEDQERITDQWKASVKTASNFDESFCFRHSGGYNIEVHAMAVHNKDEHGHTINSLGTMKKIQHPQS